MAHMFPGTLRNLGAFLVRMNVHRRGLYLIATIMATRSMYVYIYIYYIYIYIDTDR